MNWSRFILSVAAVYLPISASAQEHRWPTDQEQEQAAKPYQNCMRIEAERIDDGKGDVAAIGWRVALACQPQFDQMIDAIGQNLTPDERDTLRKSQMDMRAGYGAVAVQKVRIERGSTKPANSN